MFSNEHDKRGHRDASTMPRGVALRFGDSDAGSTAGANTTADATGNTTADVPADAEPDASPDKRSTEHVGRPS